MNMKKTMSCLILGLMAFAFTTTGCGDKGDDPPPPPPKTKTQLISQGTWRFSNATWGTTNMNSMLQDCWKDNTMLFVVVSTGTGTGTIDEGPTKCNGGDPQSRPFTWLFTTNETVLSVDTPILPGGTSNFTIVSLTATELVVKQPYTAGPVTQDATVTFIH